MNRVAKQLNILARDPCHVLIEGSLCGRHDAAKQSADDHEANNNLHHSKATKSVFPRDHVHTHVKKSEFMIIATLAHDEIIG
jgi:hypothetical protein